MNDTSSDNTKNLGPHLTEAGKTIESAVQSATAAIAAAAGDAQEIVEHATAATTAAIGQPKQALDEAGEAAQQAWSRAAGVAEDVVDAGRHATRSVSRQINQNPWITLLVGVALGYLAGWWMHGSARLGHIAADHPSAKVHRRKKSEVAASEKKPR